MTTKKTHLNRIVITIASILLVSVLYFFIKAINATNWDENFNSKNKNPFDLTIFTTEIETFLPNKKINKYDTDLNLFLDSKYNPSLNNQTIIIIKPAIDVELDLLVDYIKEGNDIFLIAKHIFIDYNSDSFSIQPNTNITFTNPLLADFSTKIPYRIETSTVNLSTNFKPEVLGKANDKNVYIRYKIGAGNLYIHSIPHVFSNHYLINHTSEYPSAVLSYVKQNEVTLLATRLPVYNNYKESKQANEGVKQDNSGLLSFILSNKYLKSAWYLFIIAGIVYVIFRAKRVQRVIPIIAENKNKTLEFVQTISSIYYNNKNNLTMVKKLNQQFLYKVEKRYNIKTENLDENFIQKLAQASRADLETVKIAVETIKLHSYTAIEPSRKSINEHYSNLKKIIN